MRCSAEWQLTLHNHCETKLKTKNKLANTVSGKQVTLDFVSQYYKVHNNNLKPQWKEYTNLKYL